MYFILIFLFSSSVLFLVQIFLILVSNLCFGFRLWWETYIHFLVSLATGYFGVRSRLEKICFNFRISILFFLNAKFGISLNPSFVCISIDMDEAFKWANNRCSPFHKLSLPLISNEIRELLKLPGLFSKESVVRFLENFISHRQDVPSTEFPELVMW
jgi:hypothetical protein